MNSLVALQGQQPQIDAVGQFAQGQAQGVAIKGEQQRQAMQSMQNIGAMALGVMGGDLNGTPDPQRWEQALDMLGQNGIPVDSLRGRPELAPLAARGAMTAMQQLQNARSEEQMDLAVQQFERSIFESDRSHGLAQQQMAFNQAQASRPEPTYTQLTPDEVTAAGLDPNKAWQRSPAGQITQIGGSGQTINVGGNNDIGTIPSGYMVDRDPQGNVIGMRPIPGGEADLEQQDAADREGVQASSDAQQAGAMLDITSQVRDIVENAGTPATGTNSLPFALHSGTPAGRIRALVVPLQSGVALNAMMRLKAASAQGATGFGAMNQQELGLLINEIGALNPNNTEPDIFLQTLDRIEDRYRRVVDDIAANVTPERIEELGLKPIIDAAKSNTPGGGDAPSGVDPELWQYMTPEERALWN